MLSARFGRTGEVLLRDSYPPAATARQSLLPAWPLGACPLAGSTLAHWRNDRANKWRGDRFVADACLPPPQSRKSQAVTEKKCPLWFRSFDWDFYGWLSSKEACSGRKVRSVAGLDQAAPDPRKTAGMVLARICRSSHRDQLRTYSRSSSIHWWKGSELRPFTCQRHVMPG